MSEQSNKVEKIKKSSNVAMFLARIGKIFMIAMAGISVVCGIGLILLDVTADAQTRQKLDAVELAADMETGIEILGFRVSTRSVELITDGQATWVSVLGISLAVLSVALVFMAVALHFVAKTFQEICDSDSPFRPVILKNLRLPFILITLMAAGNSLFFGALAGIAFWCVYCILDYGCELQRQSDETL